MDTIYITQKNCSIRREGQHLRLTTNRQTLNTVPLTGVKTAILLDSVNLTSPARDLLLDNGIDVIYLSDWGKIKGRIISSKGGGAVLRLAQHSTFISDKKRIEISRAIVAEKIHNQQMVVKRYQYNNSIHNYDCHMRIVKEYSAKLDNAESINEIMGIEGVTAKYYWDCFRTLLKNPVFTRREYRPSPDYVNALLNLGYAFLSNEITTCLIAKHFDLEIGFLHSIHYGRNSLSLDIMEEFRAPFVDSWILSLVNKNQIKEEHFLIRHGDYRLTEEGFSKFCRLHHNRIDPWREKFRQQVEKLKKSLIGDDEYEPYSE